VASKRQKEELKQALNKVKSGAEERMKKFNQERKEQEEGKVIIKKAAHKARKTEIVVTWGNKILDEGFTMIPNVLIENYKNIGITDTDMLIILAILRFSFRGKLPFPAQKTLSEITGYSRRTIIRSIKKLKMLGYITVLKRYIKRENENPQRTSNLYNLHGLMEKLNTIEV